MLPNIEAVTVCVNYPDFLAEVIPYNLPMFDRWIIVTQPSDEETRELCRKFGLYCLLSDEGHRTGSFSKGRLIERGLQHTSAEGLRIHLDADIVLPRHFRMLLEMAMLKEDTIYGVDRIMVRSWEQWQKLKATKYLEGGQYSYSHAVNFPTGYDLGTRWAAPYTSWTPIGFFQAWFSSQDEWRGIRIKPYPERHNSACRTDIQHSLQWDRNKRELIPEVIVAHLASEECPNGTNWNGRKTKRFGPETNKCIYRPGMVS